MSSGFNQDPSAIESAIDITDESTGDSTVADPQGANVGSGEGAAGYTLIKEFNVTDLSTTQAAAVEIAKGLARPACVYLYGGLGAGKTTLCQGIISALGNTSPVTSPTYNLFQEYPTTNSVVYHMDLYRLNEPEELEFLALADLWQANSIFLIEWPDKGIGFLPQATHVIELDVDQNVEHEQRSIRLKIPS